MAVSGSRSRVDRTRSDAFWSRVWCSRVSSEGCEGSSKIPQTFPKGGSSWPFAAEEELALRRRDLIFAVFRAGAVGRSQFA